ncbi:MAG: DUF3540 domain-containing protein [Gammaproteobacteria bacterium]|nr:DUF3540 domain-containing protein [Gammaproteobacteria bacterium]
MADIIEFKGKKHRLVGLEEGEVLSENAEGLYEVLMSDGPIWMKKCDGCLLKPEVGDEVIVVVTKKSVAILSILKAHGLDEKARTLDLGHYAILKADNLVFESANYYLATDYATESIKYAKMITSDVFNQESARINIQTDQFAVN